MAQTRRQMLSLARAGLSSSILASSLGVPFGISRAEAKQTPVRLPGWSYGDSSVATDTVLMFRGNGSHTFYGTGPLPDAAPEVQWRFGTAVIRNTVRGTPMVWSGTGWTGTAVKLDNYVFFGSVGGFVYALEALSGSLVWSHRGGGMFKSSPCIYENRLYVGNTDNLLRCLDARTGELVWRVDTGKDLDSSPCVIDGRLYIAGENGHVRCLDPRTGKQIWKRFVGGIGPGSILGSNGSETSPAVADGEVYTATYDGVLWSLDSRTGDVRWRAQTGDDTDASPVIQGDFVFAAAEEKAPYVNCFSREDGRLVWRSDGRARGHYSTPAIWENRLYIGGEDGHLHCFNAASGERVWAFRTGAAVWCSPCVIDGKVVFGSRDHHLYCVDALSGQEIWKVRLDGRIISSPCIVDGVIWVGTATGYFYCLSG